MKFNGTDYTSTFSGTNSAGDFTAANTNLAGFTGDTANNASYYGRVDNFTVSDVPEPSSWAGSALLVIAACWRLRRARVA